MENYLAPLNRSSQTTKLILPSYVKLIEQLRENTNPNIRLKDALTTRTSQLHMVWTNAGLLVYIPKETDPSYVLPRIDQTLPLDQQTDERTRRQQQRQAAQYGQFADTQLFEWDKGAKQVLSELVNDVSYFLNVTDATFKSTTRPPRDLKKKCLTSETAEFTKQMRFVAIGMLHKNRKTVPAIGLYQHLLYRMSAEMILKGAGYRQADERFYNNLLPIDLYRTSPIEINNQPMTYISRVIEFNPQEDVWLQTGGAVMITSGQRDNQRLDDGIETVKREPAASICLTLDDDDDSANEDICT